MLRITQPGRLRVSSLTALMSALATALAAWTTAQAGVPAAQVYRSTARPAPQTDRLIVKYRDGSAELVLPGGRAAVARAPDVDALSLRLNAAQRLAERHGANLGVVRQLGTGAHVLKLDRRLPVAQMEQLAAQIAADDVEVEYAEADRKLFPLLTPTDPSYNLQWDLYEATAGIRAPAAWDQSTGAGVVVAVIDTGYRPHADLSGQIVAGYDLIADVATANDGNARDNDPSDPGDWNVANECGAGDPASDSSWHGTHVAGTIAARTNNGLGVAGIAFDARIQPVRVLGKCGGYMSDIADGITWASGGTVAGLPANPTPARVLNLSLGGYGSCGTTSQTAINGARARGATVVVAAGNSNADAAGFNPASCAGVIAVAATDRNGARAYYSNFGAVVDLAAPGGDARASASSGILSTLNAGASTPGADNYAYYQGTSMAAPHVAGVAALMVAANPAATPDQIEAALKSTARAFPGTCGQCGTGLLDANAAVAAIKGGPPATIAEVEPNNSRSAAQAIAAPGTVAGALASTSDGDYFKIVLPAGRTLAATLKLGAAVDYDLYLYNAGGSMLRASENGAGLDDLFSHANQSGVAQTLFVRVRYYSGGAGAYTLSLGW